MKYITEKSIINQLTSIKNKFNTHFLNETSIKSQAKFIIYNEKKNKKRTRLSKESLLEYMFDEYKREEIRTFKHIIVVGRPRSNKYYLYMNRERERVIPIIDIFVNKRKGETIQKVFDIAKKFNQIHEQRYVTTKVTFPSGNLLFANFFKNLKADDYAFPVPDELKHSESINHSVGEQNTMKILSDTHGLGYAQLSNTSASVYIINNDKIIVTSRCPYYEDNEGFEQELKAPSEWQYLGDVCCEVWRIEVIDQENFDKVNDALPIDDKEYEYDPPIKGKVTAGVWTIKNQHHFIGDHDYTKKGEFPVWVELTRDK